MNELLKLDIQRFSDGKVVISTELDTKNFEKGIDTMQNKAKSGGATIKNIVAGLGITKLIAKAFSLINENIDSAVARVDTLNNFPKVMSNLGISAEEADKSIKKMSDKLSGLPTTLDQGAMAVQRFSSANGDVAKSTDIFLALNNAILAGGASTEIQASALEQLSQAYAKGKPDMMEWRTAMTAMPAQLKQVATAMGYVDATALGEALRNGEVSMDEFMDAITRLNEEGIEGFQSFEQQARNSTGGIATSITVAKTQVVKGVADIINALNVRLDELGLGSLNELISNIGVKAKEGLDIIAGLIAGELTISDVMEKATNLVTTFIDTINQKLPSIIETGMTMIAELIKGIAQALPTLIPKMLETVMVIVEALLDNIDLIIDAGIELIIGLAEGLIEALPILIDKIPIIIDKLINAIIDNLPKLIEMGVTLIVKLAEGLIKAIPKLVSKIPQIMNSLINGIISYYSKMLSVGGNLLDKVKEGISNKISNLGNVGKNIVEGLWNGIKNADKWIKDKVGNFAKGILDSMKKSLGIHSPSTLFRDQVGKMIAQGVGVGFTDELKDVYKDMQNAIDIETDKMTASVQTNGSYQMAMAGTPTFNLVDNATNQTQLVVNGKVLAEVVNTENRNREVAKA